MDNPKISRKTHHRFQIIFTIIMISSLVAGCRLPWQTQSEVTTEVVDDLNEHPMLTPTREPRSDLPPALVEVRPLPASVIGLHESITLYFNQAMDHSAVEAALHFEPRISGRFDWEDSQILTFSPDQKLEPGSRLGLTIDTSAQAVNQKNFLEPVALSFQVADLLTAVQVMPDEGTQDVDPESVIFVAFNQPVVSLSENINVEPGFSLTPFVPGSGAWLNASTYVFTPDPGMDGNTTYTIQLNESLVATSGAALSPTQTIEYSFTTKQPEIIKVLPISDELLSLDGPVEMVFNLRMDVESVEENFSLTDQNGSPVPGSFEWEQNDRHLVFTPARHLSRDTTYTIRLGSETRSAGGLQALAEFETIRQTYPDFAVNTGVAPQFESYYAGFGQYMLEFTAPPDPETMDEYIKLKPEVTGARFYTYSDESTLMVNGFFQPKTIFTLTLDPGLKDIWGGKLAAPFEITFTTPPAEPSLQIASRYVSYNLVFVPASVSELILQATNIRTVSVEIAPISLEDLITLLNPDNYLYREIFLPEVREVATHQLNLTSNQREVATLPLTYRGGPLSPGFYYLGLQTPDISTEDHEHYQKYFLVVSENNLVMKVSPEQIFVWATHVDDFSPLEGAPISVYNDEGELLHRGHLDVDGQFVAELERLEDSFSTYFSVVGTPDAPDFGFSISSWQEGYLLYEQGIDVNPLPELMDAYIYTDRPIYRPGDTIYFKTLVFSREDGLPASPGLDAVTLSVHGDPGMVGRSATLFQERLVLSRFGTAVGSVDLPADAPTGYYWIEVSVDDTLIKTLYFDVATYRKPEIDLSVKFKDEVLLSGGKAFAQTRADYYFGLPAGGLNFSWTLYRKNVEFIVPGYQVGPLPDYWQTPFSLGFFPLGVMVTYGDGVTDGEGLASLTFSGTDFDKEKSIPGGLEKYSLEVTLMDESGFLVSSTDSFLVHPEKFYIGLKPDSYFGNANSLFNFSILTVDWNQAPVSGVNLEATFESIYWDVKATGNPETPYEYVEVTNLVGGASPVSNQEGKARVSFTPPDPGTYRLTLKAGNALTQVLVWVSGESGALWPQSLYNQIDIIPDQNEYQPGQDAHIFIPNPFAQGAKAIVTVERGSVLTSQVLEMPDSGTTVSVPITDESIPNLYISAILLGKDENGRPNYRQGTVKLPVSSASKALNIDLKAVPELTVPGERVTLRMEITDQAGDPIQGEFSVAVVDKALLALVPPNTQSIIDGLYRETPLSVQTSLSLFSYARQLSILPLEAGGLGGGDDGMVDFDIREDFPDTAFWQASVVTAVDGTAQLTIPLPDSLTTWVVEVRGLTEDYLVGQAEVEVQTQKPLMIRPVTPRFLVDGDLVEMAAIVHNNTTETLKADVTLVATGFTLIDTNPSQQMTMEPGQSYRVVWWGKVESVDSVNLVFQAVAGNYSDASAPIWGDLQVKRYAMPATFSTAGQLSEAGERLELVSLPIASDPLSGELVLVMNPSLLTSLVEGLEALEEPPYGDTISVLARLLANLNVYLVLQELDLDTTPLGSSLENAASSDINRLLSIQNYDGGWSWWGSSNYEEQQSNPFITAYVLLGLELANQAGFGIGEYIVDWARDYLIFQIASPGEVESAWKLDEIAFLVYALRDYDFNLSPTIDSLYTRRTELSPWALGLLALTLKEQSGRSPRLSTLVADIEARAIRSATGVHWESEHSAWMLPGTPVFNTAAVMFALAQLDPASTSLPLALGYLMSHRDSRGIWASSFESSWVSMAVAQAIKGAGYYQADYAFKAVLNDSLIAKGQSAGPESAEMVSTKTPIETLYADSPNTLLIQRDEGAGILYYRVDLHTYQPADSAPAINRGINLQRAYYLAGEGCPAADGCVPIDSISLNTDAEPQFITVVLTINLPNSMYNLMIEDFIPAGTEIINPRLLTSPTLSENLDGLFDPTAPFAQGWGWWHFNQPKFYDDFVLWTADYVPAGTYLLTYNLLPYQRGTYQVLPAHAWQMFYPEVQGTTQGDLFTIE